MKTLQDRDLGIDCDYVAEGESTAEVIADMEDHLQNEHPEDYDRVKGDLVAHVKDDEEGEEE